MRTVNGRLTIFWTVMIPVSIDTGWIHREMLSRTQLEPSESNASQP